MTTKEAKYLSRLEQRVAMLEARLANTPKAASFYLDILRELNAMRWAVDELKDRFGEER